MTRTAQTALALGAVALGGTLIGRSRRAARRLDFGGRTVVITGGSRGLGLVLARALGDEGATVVLAARDQDELDRAREELDARGARVLTLACDVSNAGHAGRLIDEAVRQTGRLDVVINNAGVIQVGPVDHMTVTDFEHAMAVHFWAALHTTFAALPHMRRAGGGRIVNISSIGGRIGVPHLVPYCASKFALAGLSDAIRGELAREGIHVTTVFPGLMRTGSPFNAWFKGQHRQEFAWFVVSDSLPVISIAAERAAAQVIDACRHGDAELVITWVARMAVVANAVVPGMVAFAMSAANRLLPGPAGGAGDRAYSGWQSVPEGLPSLVTKLTDRAALENNEVSGPSPRAASGPP